MSSSRSTCINVSRPSTSVYNKHALQRNSAYTRIMIINENRTLTENSDGVNSRRRLNYFLEYFSVKSFDIMTRHLSYKRQKSLLGNNFFNLFYEWRRESAQRELLEEEKVILRIPLSLTDRRVQRIIN